MEELKVFENAEFGSVRTTTVNGEIMFVGKDVAEILGYSNPRKAIIDHIDEEDKGVTKCDTLGGKQDLTMINEQVFTALFYQAKCRMRRSLSIGLRLMYYRRYAKQECMRPKNYWKIPIWLYRRLRH